MTQPSSSLRAIGTHRRCVTHARFTLAGFLLALIAAYPITGRGQVQQSPAERECWNRYPGHVEYVKCLASTMEPIDPAKRDWYGEFYGAKEYLNCALTQPPGDTSCDKHRLKRRHEPEYWPYAGKVPPLRWPDPPKEVVYREGMKPKEYFEALCKAEAGEFIYRTPDKVEGIYQIRPRFRAHTYELLDRYVLEDPYGYSSADASEPQNHLVQPPTGRYQYLEVPATSARDTVTFVRFYRGEPVPGKKAQILERRSSGNYSGKAIPYIVRNKPVEQLTSRYGYTWRGIKRRYDRESSIAGGELVVVDLQTNEILGLRRGFAMTRPVGPNWEISSECPPHILGSRGYRFIRQVLKPMY